MQTVFTQNNFCCLEGRTNFFKTQDALSLMQTQTLYGRSSKDLSCVYDYNVYCDIWQAVVKEILKPSVSVSCFQWPFVICALLE